MLAPRCARRPACSRALPGSARSELALCLIPAVTHCSSPLPLAARSARERGAHRGQRHVGGPAQHPRLHAAHGPSGAANAPRGGGPTVPPDVDGLASTASPGPSTKRAQMLKNNLEVARLNAQVQDMGPLYHFLLRRMAVTTVTMTTVILTAAVTGDHLFPQPLGL